MTYSIIGTGSVGLTLAQFFGQHGIPVNVANRRGAEAVRPLVADLGASVMAAEIDAALDADIIIFAVQFLDFKTVGALRADWSGKIVIDVTNAAFLPVEVQESELQGRLSSEVNADRVPGGRLVKAFNQLPMKGLAAPVPGENGRRIVFVASDHDDASTAVAGMARSIGFAPIELGRLNEGGRLIQARNALVFKNLVTFDAD